MPLNTYQINAGTQVRLYRPGRPEPEEREIKPPGHFMTELDVAPEAQAARVEPAEGEVVFMIRSGFGKFNGGLMVARSQDMTIR